jgi:ketosteroid isomerase-like protein
MKPLVLSTLFVLGSTLSSASPTRQQSLDAMIATERSFAALAAETNTRDAFLTYLADDAIMFSNGPRNGKELYASHTVDESLLAWAPAFADVSASGDFGYDTGPYTYCPKRTDQKPSRHGQFVTVWKKQPSGEWRVAFDTGCSHPAPDSAVFPSAQYSAIPLERSSSTPLENTRAALLNVENTFNVRLHKDGTTAYDSVLSQEARRLHRGSPPAISQKVIQAQLEKFSASESLQYEPLEVMTASSGDLGYVYGWVITTSTSAEKSTPQRSNYLRIWKRENGTDWRLVLELTGPG